MASGVYNIFKEGLMEKVFDLINDTINCALLDSTHTFAASSVTNDTWADVSGNEVAGTAYVAGGAALASQAVTVDNTGNRGLWDAADVTWAASTITARYAVLYDVTASDKLICCFDFGSDQSSIAGTFSIVWNASGILQLA